MQKQLNLLKRLGAPDELVKSFTEVCGINAQLPENVRADCAKLLEEQCRRFGFNDILPDGWFFRPYVTSGASHREDCAVSGSEAEAPAIEQAYRRGVAQGFALCRDLAGEKHTKEREKLERNIDRWRTRSVQRFRSRPGDEERPPRKLFGGRTSLSARLRWLVLKRDGYRCVKCGHAASTHLTLEVDHIVPVAKGGFDTPENLQTLCSLCNRGKSDLSE